MEVSSGKGIVGNSEDVLVLGISLVLSRYLYLILPLDSMVWYERWTIDFHLGLVFLVASILLVTVAIRKAVAMAAESRPA